MSKNAEKRLTKWCFSPSGAEHLGCFGQVIGSWFSASTPMGQRARLYWHLGWQWWGDSCLHLGHRKPDNWLVSIALQALETTLQALETMISARPHKLSQSKARSAALGTIFLPLHRIYKRVASIPRVDLS
jgi:hypothetical protein